MTPPALPPAYVNLPPAIVYDGSIPDGPARTWSQIYGLYWDKENPPEPTLDELMAITHKSRSALYGHLTYLRNSGWLLFGTAQDGRFKFDFTCALSKFSDLPLLISTTSNLDIDSKIGGLNIAASKNQDSKKRDPLLDNEAVKIYRELTHLTANAVQRQQLAAQIKDFGAWRATLEHWSLHGWRPTNVGGMLDSYKNGGKKACNLCKRSNGNGNHGALAELKKELGYGD